MVVAWLYLSRSGARCTSGFGRADGALALGVVALIDTLGAVLIETTLAFFSTEALRTKSKRTSGAFENRLVRFYSEVTFRTVSTLRWCFHCVQLVWVRFASLNR